MKIVIYNAVDMLTKHNHILKQIKDNYWCVDNCYDLERLIKGYPDEDIEGVIMPDAHNNPEFGDILHRIWEQKQRLYELPTRHPTADPDKFADMVEEKYYGILFVRSS